VGVMHCRRNTCNPFDLRFEFVQGGKKRGGRKKEIGPLAKSSQSGKKKAGLCHYS